MGLRPIPPHLFKKWDAGKDSSHGGQEESICPLANKIRRQGQHGLCEYVLTDRLTSSAACGDGRLHHSIIRVCPPQERVQGQHGLCEHVLTDKLTSSAACGDNGLHHSIIRVSPSAGARAAMAGSTAPPIGYCLPSANPLSARTYYNKPMGYGGFDPMIKKDP